MSPNFIQEQLSLAYARSVLYRAGYRLYRPEVDDHGLDGTIVDPHARGINRIDFQAKATTVYEIRETTIVYDLRVEDYNRLIGEDDVPRVLILLIMPEDDSQWLTHSSERLCLRRCAYWADLMGKPHSNNASTVRVSLSTDNMFDQDGLSDMFRQLTA